MVCLILNSCYRLIFNNILNPNNRQLMKERNFTTRDPAKIFADPLVEKILNATGDESNEKIQKSVWDKCKFMEEVLPHLLTWDSQGPLNFNSLKQPSLLSLGLCRIKFLRLKGLKMEENQITSIQKLYFLQVPQLEFFSISNNKITNWQPIRKIDWPLLKTLDITDNHATQFNNLTMIRAPILNNLFIDQAAGRKPYFGHWPVIKMDTQCLMIVLHDPSPKQNFKVFRRKYSNIQIYGMNKHEEIFT